MTQKNELTQQLPNSKQLEETVLGTLLLDNTAIYKVMQFLSDECFYTENNCIIYQAIVVLFNNKTAIDILTVTEQLRKMKYLDKIGGPYELIELTNRITSAAHLESHAIMLYEYFQRRQMIDHHTRMARMAYDMSNDVPSMLEQTRKKLFSNNNISGGRISNVSDIVKKIAQDAMDANYLHKQVQGIPSCYEQIDLMLSGFIGGRFYVIGGRPSMGKTTLVINIVANTAKMFGTKGLFFSGEMSGEDITKIMIAQQMGIPIDHISQNAITAENWKQILDACCKGFGENLHIDDTAGPSLLHIESESIKMVQKHNIKFIVVDYLQLVTVNDKGMNKLEKVSAISARLKALAKNLNVPVIALSQLSRSCETRPNKRPVMSDLKETGDIEQDADIIGFIYRPEYYGTYEDAKGNSLKNIVEINWAKNKFGRIGTILMYYDRNIGRFQSYDTRNMQPVEINSYDKTMTEFKKFGAKPISLPLPEGISEDDIPF